MDFWLPFALGMASGAALMMAVALGWFVQSFKNWRD